MCQALKGISILTGALSAHVQHLAAELCGRGQFGKERVLTRRAASRLTPAALESGPRFQSGNNFLEVQPWVSHLTSSGSSPVTGTESHKSEEPNGVHLRSWSKVETIPQCTVSPCFWHWTGVKGGKSNCPLQLNVSRAGYFKGAWPQVSITRYPSRHRYGHSSRVLFGNAKILGKSKSLTL